MYTNTLAFAYTLQAPSLKNGRRTLVATVLFATGAIVGWPFALAVSIPFILEELFVYGLDNVRADKRTMWFGKRLRRLISAGMVAALLFVRSLSVRRGRRLFTGTFIQIPVVGIDSLLYGKLNIVPWNIIKYNIFGGSSRGPELYGTEPWHFYLLNLLLNFNIAAPLALAALPALVLTYFIDRSRLSLPVDRNGDIVDSTTDDSALKDHKPAFGKRHGSESSPYTLLTYRLMPFYVWFAVLTVQPHKEERFMFPIYPILAFNAAVTLYLIRGWFEVAYIRVTSSQYKVSNIAVVRDADI